MYSTSFHYLFWY